MKETFPTGKQKKKKNHTKCLSYSIENNLKKKKKENYKNCRLGDLQAKGFRQSAGCTIMYYNLLNFKQIMIKLI